MINVVDLALPSLALKNTIVEVLILPRVARRPLGQNAHERDL